MNQTFKYKANDHQLMGVVVPGASYDFDIYNTYRKELRYLIKGEINPLTDSEQLEVIDLKLPTLQKVKILGIVTYPDVVDFDCEKIECLFIETHKIEAEKAGFYWGVNPLGREPRKIFYERHSVIGHRYNNPKHLDWQAAEAKVIYKAVIIEIP